MRIALLADPIDLQHAGIHRYTVELAHALASFGSQHDYLIVCAAKHPELDLEQLVVPFSNKILRPSFRMFVEIPRKLRQWKPDVVVEPAHFGPWFLPRSVKRITIIHDLTPRLFPQWHRLHSQWLQRLFLGGILNRADVIITNSKRTNTDLLKLYNKSGSPIYPGINSQFLPGSVQRDAYFISVGSIEPRKNLELILKAFEAFYAEHPNFKWIIVGSDGWKNKSFYRALRNSSASKAVEVKQRVSDSVLVSLYQNAQALLCASHYEGFGFPLIEAMASGCRVVSSPNGSLSEVGGQCAIYIDSPQEMKQAMEFVVAEPESERLIWRAKAEKYCTQYSWQSFVRSFEKLVDSLQ